MSNSVRPHIRQPTRLLCPWDSPGKNTGVGCHFLLQCMKVKSQSEVAQSCPTLSDPIDCGPPGSSVHGIFQARVLEWGAIAFSVPFPSYLYLILGFSWICQSGSSRLLLLLFKKILFLVLTQTKNSAPSSWCLNVLPSLTHMEDYIFTGGWGS